MILKILDNFLDAVDFLVDSSDSLDDFINSLDFLDIVE